MKRFGILVTIVALTLSLALSARAADERHEIQFPDLPGYQTLACDLHMHTVFSDGLVWPTVRVAEAWRQGLDVIAITDHIEYQPHKDDVPTKHNRPYELAAGNALAAGILLVRAAEITRETPPGHFNAIFLKDVQPLDTKDLLEAVRLANEQGAFLWWNHQAWKGEENGRWLDIHQAMFENGWLHGLEVANGDSYYPTAHQWCLDKKLTMMGNSDIHDPDPRSISTAADHRTLTLVFAQQPTLDGVRDALRAGRTVVWYQNQLIGRPEWIEPLVQACIQVAPPHLRTAKDTWLRIRNVGNADISLQRTAGPGPAELTLLAGTTSLVKLGVGATDQPLKLEYTATNCLVAPGQGLPLILTVPAP